MAPSDLITFCEEQHGRLVGLVALYCGDRFLAEEIAQEALARACRDWKKVRELDRPDAWVYRVALNLTRSFFRRKAIEMRARRELENSQPVPHGESRDLDLRDAVRRLPSRVRSVILLRYFIGMSVAEVAAALDIPEGTVKTLTRRGISRLRSQEMEVEASNAI